MGRIFYNSFEKGVSVHTSMFWSSVESTLLKDCYLVDMAFGDTRNISPAGCGHFMAVEITTDTEDKNSEVSVLSLDLINMDLARNHLLSKKKAEANKRPKL